MSELKPCPFCGEPADDRYNRLAKCSNKSCLMNHWVDDEDFFIDDDWNTRPIEDALRARIAELEAERDQAKAIVSRLRDFLFDYTQFHISTNPEERWWALVDKFDELVKESEE